MISEKILFAVLVVSVLTTLTVEAFKKLMAERHKKSKPNTIAGLVSLGITVVLSVIDKIMNDLVVDTAFIINTLSVACISWLCAMVGYDKVIQMLKQIKR